MQSRFFRLLVSLAFTSFTRADYYIDDQNYTSLVFSENPEGAKWGPFQEGGETLSISLANGTMMTIDASHCFNYTYTYAACTASNDCQVQIPFVGSGITIYVLQAGAQGINASLAIDDKTPEYSVLAPPLGPSFYTPNVTLFSVQGMVTGNHTATMTVLSWDNIFSGMMFDYAMINQTVVSAITATTTSSSAAATGSLATSITPTATITPSSSHSGTNIGAVIGGVIGGVVIFAVLAFGIFYFRRRSRRSFQTPDFDIDDADPKVEPFVAEHLYDSERFGNIPSSSTTERLATAPVNMGTNTQVAISHVTTASREKALIGITNPSLSQIVSASAFPAVSHARTGSSSIRSPSSSDVSRRIQQENPMLSDDQADFVNNLYVNNVPAAAIARVIERMIAGEGRPEVEYDSLPPPSYGHASGDT